MTADRMERIAATQRAETIRDGLMGLASAMTTIAEAFERKDWKVLGYKSWGAYCQGEFGQNRLKLAPDQREQIAIAFRGAGMSKRQIADALGVGEATVRRSLKSAPNDALLPSGGPVDTALSRLSATLSANGPIDNVSTDAGRANVEAILNAVEWALANGGTEELYAGHLGVIETMLRRTGFTVEQIDELIGRYRQFEGLAGIPLVASLRAAIEETAAHTSAAGHAANPEGDSPVLGEPVGVDEQASTGTQSPPAADASTTLPHAGVPAVGDQIEERDEEEAAEASADLPAAATTSLPDGDGNPLPEQSQQPGQDSPPVLGSEGFPGRAETDHQQVARVSPAGVAPGSGSGPQYADPVEPVELEDGDAAVTPSSSDPDEEEEATPTDLLFRLFGALMTLIDHVDAEAVGPLLLLAEVEQLHQHVDVLTAFVAKVSMAQFQASQRTP